MAGHRHPAATLGEIRLDQAKDRLAGSAEPIVEIALGVGFSEQSAFTRAFRRRFGESPAAYRRRLEFSAQAAIVQVKPADVLRAIGLASIHWRTAMRLTDFKVLTFDCYGTLIDWESGILAALRPLLGTLGGKLDDEAALVAFAAHETALEKAQPGLNYRKMLARVLSRPRRRSGTSASPKPRPSASAIRCRTGRPFRIPRRRSPI